MTKRATIGAACATLFVGATVASAKPHDEHANNGNRGASAAAKLCTASKKADRGAFIAVWGKHGMRDCIRANRGTAPSGVAQQTSDFVNAARECRDARDADAAAFVAFWGTNTNHRNAFGKCVSARAHENRDERGTA